MQTETGWEKVEITRGTYHRPALALRLGSLLAALLGACGDPARNASGESSAAAELPALPDLSGPRARALFELEELGEVRIEMFPELAPQTVANFEKLAREGYYDGTTFHRVIPGFMLQGGDPNTRDADPRNDGRGGPDYAMPRETSAWSHRRGTVSWAASGRTPSGSQFFIVLQDSPHLDGQHNVIGRVVEGMQVLDRVAALEIDSYGRYGPQNRPYPVDARIRRIQIEPAHADAARTASAAPVPEATAAGGF